MSSRASIIRLDTSRVARRLRTWVVGILLLTVVATVVIAVVSRSHDGVPARASVLEALKNRGRVLCLGDLECGSLHVDGTSWPAPESPSIIAAALVRDHSDDFVRALERGHIAGVLVARGSAEPSTVWGALRNFAAVEGLRGVFVSEDVAYYELDPNPTVDAIYGLALATVSRRMLEGADAPQERSFPEPLRVARAAEVLVALRDGQTDRMWRSARGTSIANALLVATAALKTRWQERASAMGESLPSAMRHLNVVVSMMNDDGTLESQAGRTLDVAITDAHGVGYSDRSDWKYALPHAVRQAGGGRNALRHLLEEAHESETTLLRADVRVYRFTVTEVGVSAPGEEITEGGSRDSAGPAPTSSAAGSLTTNVVPTPS